MKDRFRSEADDWSPDGPKINSPDAMNTIRKCIEESGPVIVEHRFYRGSSAPDFCVFNDVEKFEEYLNTAASAGDSIYVWDFVKTCGNDNILVNGKCPDKNGLIPKGGAY